MNEPLIVHNESLWRDIASRAQEIEQKDFVYEHAPQYIIDNLERAANKPWAKAMADGLFYRDTRTPMLVTDNASITLSTTALDLWLVAQYSTLPANYWTPGKTVKMTCFGKLTTAVTPGNGTWSISGDPTVATNSVSSAAKALTASQANFTMMMEGWVTCRSIGAAGTLQIHGIVYPNVVQVASTLQPVLVPDVSATTVASNTTIASAARMMMLRSGSTAETFVATGLYIEAMN